MIKFAQRMTLAAVVTVASLLWVQPVTQSTVGGSGIIRAESTIAQRYPLRARSKDFYNRSKISNAKGK